MPSVPPAPRQDGGPPLPSYDDPGPLLTTDEATALHARAETVAWFAVPGPDGGVIARAHTEAHNGGCLLPGHLAASDLAGLHALMPPGLTFYSAPEGGPLPGCLGWWFGR